MVLITENDFKDAIQKIRGVKSVDIMVVDPGRVIVHVRYKFWVDLIPWISRRISKKVNDLIYNERPYGVSMGAKCSKS